jgi:hypothetical protein
MCMCGACYSLEGRESWTLHAALTAPSKAVVDDIVRLTGWLHHVSDWSTSFFGTSL